MIPLTYDIFQEHPRITHATYQRHGGVSEGPFATLNLSRSVGDDPERVEENIRRVYKNARLTELHFAAQPHGVGIQKVTSSSPSLLTDCDVLVTSEPNVALAITHADCQATILYDPLQEVLALVHAGWRGLVQNVYQVTLNHLKEQWGCKPENLLVAISPSLGPTASEFVHYKKELPKAFWEFQTTPNHFDLWAIGRAQLETGGVLPHHLELTEICTYCTPKDYFSYRREGTTGRHATLAMLHGQSP